MSSLEPRRRLIGEVTAVKRCRAQQRCLRGRHRTCSWPRAARRQRPYSSSPCRAHRFFFSLRDKRIERDRGGWPRRASGQTWWSPESFRCCLALFACGLHFLTCKEHLMMPEHLGARRVLLGCDRKQATPPEAPPPGKEGRLWDLPVSAAPGLGEPGVQCHGVPTTAVKVCSAARPLRKGRWRGPVTCARALTAHRRPRARGGPCRGRGAIRVDFLLIQLFRFSPL